MDDWRKQTSLPQEVMASESHIGCDLNDKRDFAR